ncbi:MAG TPA: bifunctional glutamate N-acetyltransferase/amino-acid acetyltransferase ArgJ [Pirellulaceae bacterium]
MMQLQFPRGFRGAGVPCGLKRDAAKHDLALVVSDVPATAVGVYTTNRVSAAPVRWDRQRTPSESCRAVVLNSGNANACTGRRGDLDTRKMAEITAELCGAAADDVLVMSTGIIGHPLNMDRVESGIRAAYPRLSGDALAISHISQALMTTDTFPKVTQRRFHLGGQTVTLLGFAKGAGMIAPRMATMLGLILCDARIEPGVAQDMITGIANDSFNAISVDGHTSTNDTLLWISNGAAFPAAIEGPTEFERQLLRTELREVCIELAKSIARDGEGATHWIEIQIRAATSDADARAIARAIADSPLVKTAIAGADPNWGRIVSAAGYASPAFEPAHATLRLNEMTIFAEGEPVPFDASALSDSLRANRDVLIELHCGSGDAAATFWTCDLTAEYVRINADYHT